MGDPVPSYEILRAMMRAMVDEEPEDRPARTSNPGPAQGSSPPQFVQGPWMPGVDPIWAPGPPRLVCPSPVRASSGPDLEEDFSFQARVAAPAELGEGARDEEAA
jgi:hypothetical protein